MAIGKMDRAMSFRLFGDFFTDVLDLRPQGQGHHQPRQDDHGSCRPEWPAPADVYSINHIMAGINGFARMNSETCFQHQPAKHWKCQRTFSTEIPRFVKWLAEKMRRSHALVR